MRSGFLRNTGLVALAALLLSACGGGGGGGDSLTAPAQQAEQDAAEPPPPTIELTIVDADGEGVTTVSGAALVTLRAVVRNGEGEPLNGVVVTFTSEFGTLSPSNGRALTGADEDDDGMPDDGDGVATVQLSGGSEVGAGTIVATAQIEGIASTSNNVGIQFQGQQAEPTVTFSVIGVDLSSDQVSRDNEVTATIRVLDENGVGIDGALVQFTSTLGIIDPPSGSVFTVTREAQEGDAPGADLAGYATVTLLAGPSGGSGTVGARVTVQSETKNGVQAGFISIGDGVPTIDLAIRRAADPGAEPGTDPCDAPNGAAPGDIALVGLQTTTNPDDTTVETLLAERLEAVVRDARGNRVSGAIVTFSLVGDGADFTRTIDLTNACGIADTVLQAETAVGFGTVSARADFAGQSVFSAPDGAIVYQSLGAGVFEGEGSSNLSIALELVITGATEGETGGEGEGEAAPTTSRQLSADNPGTLRATVLGPPDEDGNPVGVPDVIVRFSADLGDLFPANGLALTNSSGDAFANLAAGSVPGAGVARASIVFDGQTFDTESITFETLGNAGDTPISLNDLNVTDATPDENVIITPTSTARVVLTVRDTGQNILPFRNTVITTSLGSLRLAGTTELVQNIDTDSGDDGVIDFEILTTVVEGEGEGAGQTMREEAGSGNVTITVGNVSSVLQFLAEDGGGLQIGACVTLPCNDADPGIDTDDLVEGSLKVNAISAADLLADPTLEFDNVEISARGTTSIQVIAQRTSGEPIEGATLSFSSTCSTTVDPVTTQPRAIITASGQTDQNGLISASYQAEQGCVGDDVVTVVESSTGQSATGTIAVREPAIGSIAFDSVVVDVERPELQTIQIRESGGITTAQVNFQVLDKFNEPSAGRAVRLELTSSVGGLELEGQNPTTGVAQSVTDSDGVATAFVQAGFIPTTVRVRASIDVPIDEDDDGEADPLLVNGDPVFDEEGNQVFRFQTLVTLSGILTVNTGVPDQNSMTIAATDLNFDGENFVGLQSDITVLMSDAFNNPVPDGTPVSFTTEYGSIEGSCVTEDGGCSVKLTAQNPRRPNDPASQVGLLELGQCPTHLINEEVVPVIDDRANTDYVLAGLLRVETDGDVALVSGTDYVLDTDGSGISCLTPAACTDGDAATACLCENGGSLKISYFRRYLDEDAKPGNSDFTNAEIAALTDMGQASQSAGLQHTISSPGVASAPYRQILNNLGVQTPCLARERVRGVGDSGYPGGLGQPMGGRTTVLAFSQGEESFVDTNGNGIYDFNEPFIDLTEAFLDKNEDDVFGNGDPSVDESRAPDSTRTCYGPAAPLSDDGSNLPHCVQVGGEEETFFEVDPNARFDVGNGIYNGTLCPLEVSGRTSSICSGSTCTIDDRYCTRDLVNISRDITILFSGSFGRFGFRAFPPNVTTISEYYYQGENIDEVDFSLAGPGEGLFRADRMVRENDGDPVPAGQAFRIGLADDDVPLGVGESALLIWGGTGQTDSSAEIFVDASDIFGGFLPHDMNIGITSGTDGCLVTNNPGGAVVFTNRRGFTTVRVGLDNPANTPPSGALLTASTGSTVAGEQSSIRQIFCSH